MKYIENRCALACQVMTNIRFRKEITWQELKGLFKGSIPYNATRHQAYLLDFFENNCRFASSKYIKDFMKEQDISKENIISILNKLPKNNEQLLNIQECMRNGEF